MSVVFLKQRPNSCTKRCEKGTPKMLLMEWFKLLFIKNIKLMLIVHFANANYWKKFIFLNNIYR